MWVQRGGKESAHVLVRLYEPPRKGLVHVPTAVVTKPVSGKSTLSGQADPEVTVVVGNETRGTSVSTLSDKAGKYLVTIDASKGNQLVLFAVNPQNFNASGVRRVQVPVL
jgi:hypothetical protein